MTTTGPAEQRRIIRRTVENALRQHTASKPGAAPALTAVRDVTTAMDGVTGARFWAQQLHDALNTRPGGPGSPITWCGASTPGLVGAEPIGPCILRADHDGPVHQTASGAKWWLADGGVLEFPETIPAEEVEAFRSRWTKAHTKEDQ